MTFSPAKPDGLTFRFMGMGDSQLLSSFECGGDPCSDEVEAEIRNHLFEAWMRESHVTYSPQKVEVILAFDGDGVLVGVAAYKPYVKNESFESSLLAVSHGFRRRGVATFMKTLAMNKAQRFGAEIVFSAVRVENMPMNAVNAQWENITQECKDGQFNQTYIPFTFKSNKR